VRECVSPHNAHILPHRVLHLGNNIVDLWQDSSCLSPDLISKHELMIKFMYNSSEFMYSVHVHNITHNVRIIFCFFIT
jgi:hypothetical protein